MLKLCRICDNEFTPCGGLNGGVPGMENWRQFCCSLDCAVLYHKKVMDSRQNTNQTTPEELNTLSQGDVKKEEYTSYKKKRTKYTNEEKAD